MIFTKIIRGFIRTKHLVAHNRDYDVISVRGHHMKEVKKRGNDSNLLIVFYVQIMPDDFVMQLHRF